MYSIYLTSQMFFCSSPSRHLSRPILEVNHGPDLKMMQKRKPESSATLGPSPQQIIIRF